MRILKIVSMILVLCLVSTLLLACGSKAELAEYQTATVQRGDLKTDITGVGNLALSDQVELAFEMDGTVEEVLVKEGDSVEEGQVLAKLDTAAWDDHIAALEDAVTTAEGNVPDKERLLTTDEGKVTDKELLLRQAQINLQTAENNLSAIADVKKAQDAVDDAEYNLSIAQAMWKQASLSEMSTDESNFWMSQISLAKKELADATKELEDIKAGSSVKVTTDVALDVAAKQIQVEQAQRAVETAQTAVEDAKTLVEDDKTAIDTAKKAVNTANKNLADAKSTSPEVTASFTGFIIKVNVKGGDVVKKGAVAVTLADPNKFETDILVNEMDILNVKLGENVTVQVDAVSGLSLRAKVTHISPTATIQQGVVNYKVKVEVQSLEEALQEQREAMQKATQERQQASDNFSSGALPGRFEQAFGSSNLTQEQINQMMQQRQQALAGQVGGQQQQMPTMVPEGFQLREGLTVTVSIVVDQRSNVLLVPQRALSRSGTQTVVKVLKDGVAESRSITTGLSNGTYTEVTEGLSEGEQVVIPQATTTTTPTQQPGGGMEIFGIGR